jgi:hypothetical protein
MITNVMSWRNLLLRVPSTQKGINQCRQLQQRFDGEEARRSGCRVDVGQVRPFTWHDEAATPGVAEEQRLDA